ncbi:bifunctional 4-hydroxy-2-oxoglutarate aldolase/2-dehydro-3-deoxy-phosphogluconate aldolase [uncultured Ruegeria sp.]|uniref:bifunctional 4-hydroxy-2-oxoglutarate aldolase/2-dehydro-3-deoxy-phosphogluconate aldolase n=1 Tax=uncultured Ruegeria sp. TaxID=259304 RepID=UPI002601AFDC|nr:bifunctional 4-hydroxy-2-oxoglutarate aldolase/2-dehydro-3-deoxy-phosphogluconate aldolase [uncultured Ruegeria sp.]
MSSPSTMKSEQVMEICALCPVIPVLEVQRAEDAVPLAQALLAGGLRVLEVTMRTDDALNAISEMSTIKGAVVGAGTLRTPEDVRAAKQAGAAFGVSPGATDSLLAACETEKLPILPGAATASEMMALLEKGYIAQKFFPAEASGGQAALKSLGGPLPKAKFCPTGGITPQTAKSYLGLKNVMCVGGSWIAPKDLVASKNWKEIENRAQLTSKLKE